MTDERCGGFDLSVGCWAAFRAFFAMLASLLLTAYLLLTEMIFSLGGALRCCIAVGVDDQAEAAFFFRTSVGASSAAASSGGAFATTARRAPSAFASSRGARPPAQATAELIASGGPSLILWRVLLRSWCCCWCVLVGV